MPRTLKIIAAAFLIVGAFLYWLGPNLERFINRVEPIALPGVSEEARRIHDASLVADLHADSLLFGRDLLVRSEVGHVDLDRLREGGVALQAFFLVTRVPVIFDVARVSETDPDLFSLAAAVQRSPAFSLGPRDRALWQAQRMAEMIARSDGGLRPIRTRADLDSLVEARREDPSIVGALLGVEGAHAVGEEVDGLDLLFEAGVRVVGLAHFFDNHYSGSAHGVEKGGLTEAGRTLVAEMERLGIAVDLAHVSPRAIDDVLAMATKPVLVSHTGVRATCDSVRNLSDDQIRSVAANGGVIGIGYFELAVCGIDPGDAVAAIRHVVELVGDDHAALGSDYDGGTTVGFDTADLRVVTQQMLDDGLPEESIHKILGSNTFRVLRQTLPPGE